MKKIFLSFIAIIIFISIVIFVQSKFVINEEVQNNNINFSLSSLVREADKKTDSIVLEKNEKVKFVSVKKQEQNSNSGDFLFLLQSINNEISTLETTQHNLNILLYLNTFSSLDNVLISLDNLSSKYTNSTSNVSSTDPFFSSLNKTYEKYFALNKAFDLYLRHFINKMLFFLFISLVLLGVYFSFITFHKSKIKQSKNKILDNVEDEKNKFLLKKKKLNIIFISLFLFISILFLLSSFSSLFTAIISIISTFAVLMIFGIKDILTNYVLGFFIKFKGTHLNIGDVIILDNKEYTLTKNTSLEQILYDKNEGKYIFIENQKLISSNYRKRPYSRYRSLSLNFFVSNSIDLEELEGQILESFQLALKEDFFKTDIEYLKTLFVEVKTELGVFPSVKPYLFFEYQQVDINTVKVSFHLFVQSKTLSLKETEHYFFKKFKNVISFLQ